MDRNTERKNLQDTAIETAVRLASLERRFDDFSMNSAVDRAKLNVKMNLIAYVTGIIAVAVVSNLALVLFRVV